MSTPARPPGNFEITVDGEPVPARRGQSLAAALFASGRASWRRTRGDGRPRGLFCGIGVCFDCLATVNGIPNVRVCLAEAQPGDTIHTQEGTGHDARGC
ncbi:(2Fe-2S)-binding protein [Lipingzhangella sp. LS1_29]|uniref:(2Fe-2S)-binding protein n=1 Tax=Lipingzhangella rawalii TaxID=2055835 RepID=A0ABU2H758_9ACTN|nr:(2Fe-2S)-binding protein [Lipingzhangella rawalii]MDS1271141.1 (2Fe-2S)-binding protein [Lipingzhangella rawalii]